MIVPALPADGPSAAPSNDTVPLARRRALEPRDPGEAPHACAHRLAGGARERLGQLARVDVAVGRIPQRALQPVVLDRRVTPLHLLGRHQLVLETERVRHRSHVAELLQPSARLREADRAGPVVGDRVVGVGGEPGVELGGVLLQPDDVAVAGEGRDVAGRVPGRARRELVHLEQHGIGPASLGEVVEDAGAGDASTDDDNPCVILHVLPVPPCATRRSSAALRRHCSARAMPLGRLVRRIDTRIRRERPDAGSTATPVRTAAPPSRNTRTTPRCSPSRTDRPTVTPRRPRIDADAPRARRRRSGRTGTGPANAPAPRRPCIASSSWCTLSSRAADDGRGGRPQVPPRGPHASRPVRTAGTPRSRHLRKPPSPIASSEAPPDAFRPGRS